MAIASKLDMRSGTTTPLISYCVAFPPNRTSTTAWRTFKRRAIAPKGKQPAEKTFRGRVTQLGSAFRPGMPLYLTNRAALIEQNALQNVPVNVTSTKRKFQLGLNGFEFHRASARFGKALNAFAKDLGCDKGLMNYRPGMRDGFQDEVEQEMTQKAKQLRIDFDRAICVDAVCRDTGGGRFGAVQLVHIDFPPTNYALTLKGHGEWHQRVAKRLGLMSKQTYEKLAVARILNVWMPLDARVEADPLALMDTQTLNPADVHCYEAERVGGGKFPALGVIPRATQRWYVREGMGLGDALIFDSCRTPHTAVVLPNQGKKTRKSVECRVLFVKDSNP